MIKIIRYIKIGFKIFISKSKTYAIKTQRLLKGKVKQFINRAKFYKMKLKRFIKNKLIQLIFKRKVANPNTTQPTINNIEMDQEKDIVIILTHTAMFFDDRIKRQANKLAEKYKVILFAKKDDKDSYPPGLSTNLQLIEYNNLHSRGFVASALLQIFLKPNKSFKEKLMIFFVRGYFGVNEEKLYFDYLPIYQEVYRDIIKFIDTNEIGNRIKTVIANDVFVLPIADRIGRYIVKNNNNKITIIGDMHEVHFNYNSANVFNQELRRWLCNQYLNKLNLVISVSDQGANLYNNNFKLNNVISIMNVPVYEKLSIAQNEDYNNAVRSKIRLVHTGVASPERKLEDMIEAMVYLDYKFELYFHLASNESERVKAYLESLHTLIHNLKLEDRVFIEETLKPDQLVSYINQYDIGVFYMGDVMANHQYAMPNKLFQYIMARLGVVVSDKGDMPKIVKKYDIGIVPDEPGLDAYAEAVKMVADNLRYYKLQSDKASEELCAEKEWDKLIGFIDTI